MCVIYLLTIIILTFTNTTTTTIAAGYTLGFNIEDETNTIPESITKSIIERVVKALVSVLNDGYNDSAFAMNWTMLNGKVVSVRSFYVLCWKLWNELAIDRVEVDACIAWEEIFGDVEACAAAAIEAKVNERMSKVARKQVRNFLSILM